MKYLNLLKNQSGGELKLGDTTLEVGKSRIVYNKITYTYMGEEQITAEPKEGVVFPEITRIILKNGTTEIAIPFEANISKFRLVVKK